MVSGVTKRIVVIKDIPSNLIEEAILILKKDASLGLDISGKEVITGMKNKKSDFLLKEAEYIINNYIRENKLQEVRSRKLNTLRVKMLKKRLSSNLIVNLVLAGSILFLIFIVLRTML
jgi:hypothetical protein